MKKIELEIMGISQSSTQTNNYAILLGEKTGPRRLPIVIGGYEAQAIAVAIEKMTSNRPLTHDLFKNTLESFDIEITEVLIMNLVDGVFYAQLICECEGKKQEVDARTSDAIAMAVRFNCPIFTFENVLEAAGVVLEEEGSEVNETSTPPASKPAGKVHLNKLSEAELKERLHESINNEDYEAAAKIRDELNRRKA